MGKKGGTKEQNYGGSRKTTWKSLQGKGANQPAEFSLRKSPTRPSPPHGTFSLWSSTVSVAILVPLHSARPPPAASASASASASGSSRLGTDSHGRPIAVAFTPASYHQLFPLVNSWSRPHSSRRLSPPLSKAGTWRRAGSAHPEGRKW